MGGLGRVAYMVHFISAQTSQEGIEYTKAKEYLRAYYPNTYILYIQEWLVILQNLQKCQDFGL